MYALSILKKFNKYLFSTIIIIILCLYCTSIAYADIIVKPNPTNLVVNHTNDKMKIILEFNMNGGTATITNESSVDISGYSLSDVGSFVGDGYRLIITITNTTLINNILSGTDPIDITFPSGTISNSASDTNSSDIHVTVVTPPVGTSFDISDTNEFKATATLTTSGAGTHVVTFFNKADFERHYPDEYSYFDIVPKDIQYGKLVSWGPDIKQFKDTVTISGNSLSKDFSASAVDEKPYVGVYYTESPAGQAGATDYGAYLFMSSVAEGVENDGNSSGRPALIDPKRLMSYRFSDFQGSYNAYLIATFENDIESNIFDNYSTDHLALGIDFKKKENDPYISMRYPNNFDATINGKQLIIMMDDTRFGPNDKLFFQIPKGSIKDKATGKSNKDPITIVNDYTLNSDKFTHGAIELHSINVTPYGNEADVELKLTGSGSVYNSYVPANTFGVTNLLDFATLMASANEDLDTKISANNTTEYIGGLTSSSLMTTKLSNLQPETDYLWISTAMLIGTLDGDGILEGHITKFMTEPVQLGMEMMGIKYFTGDDASVNGDDYVVVTYSEEFSNYGNDDDYNIWIDYNSNGSLDILLDTDDYTVSADPQQLGPNKVKIEFEGDMETHLINISNATLKVEVKNPSNLEPVVQNGKHYQTVHIPNRIVKATNVRLINTSPALNLEPNTFHQDDTYVFYSLLYSHLQTIKSTGTIAVDKIDPLSTLNTSALTDYPVNSHNYS